MKARKLLDKIFAEAKESGVTPKLEGYYWVEKAMHKYAELKCAEQREICNQQMSEDDCGDPDFRDFGLNEAPEPNFD